MGNAFMPLMASNPGLDGVAIDFAKTAIALLRERDDYKRIRAEAAAAAASSAAAVGGSAGVPPRLCVAHVCDLTCDELPAEATGGGGCDVILLLFCLSAVCPAKMAAGVRKLANCLRPGGMLLFRDYGAAARGWGVIKGWWWWWWWSRVVMMVVSRR